MVGIPAFSQGVVYKCIDADGAISYSSDANSNRCEKTNLGKIDQGNILNKPTSSNNSSFTKVSVPTVSNPDQIARDQKRMIILQGELSQEQSQLKIILEMISKVDKNDNSQIGQLKKMEETHKRNIASLEKELGIKAQTQPVKNISPNVLPFSLPKGAEQVELVDTPLPPSNIGRSNNARQEVQLPINSNHSVALNPSNPSNPINQVAQPEIIKEYREPAAITNKSLKKKSSSL